MKVNQEMLRYILAGILITATDFAIYFFLIRWLPFSISKGISFTVAGIVGYLLNKHWTFKQTQPSRSEVVRYWIVNFATLGVNIVVNRMMLNVWPDRVGLALAIATASSSLLCYVCFKLWVFKVAPSK